MTSGATVQDRGGCVGELSARLRAETRSAHLAAEAAFDLDRRLGSVDAYAAVLEVFEQYLRAAIPSLVRLDPALPAGLRGGAVRRRRRLAADLAALGRPVRPAPVAPAALGPPVDLDRALGSWYVHEGSALGGLVIGAEVRRRLPEAETATAYLTGDGRRTAARWRAVRATLERWPGDPEIVIEGARESFAELTDHLRACR